MRVVARSPVTQALLRQAWRIAQTDEPVLLVGETGTGKSFLARWMHEHSRRAERPFLTLYCGDLPGNVLEQKIFGESDLSEGLLARAQGGTVFLDAIEALPPELQVRLLRALATGEAWPVGAANPFPFDCRLMAAVSRDVSALASEGYFVPGFLDRLGSFQLTVPPLRDRREDIPELVTKFLDQVRPGLRVDPAVLAWFQQYDWPGNLLELRNVIRHAALLAEDEIRPEHLPAWFHREVRQRSGG